MVEDVDPFEPRIGSTTLQLPAGLVWVVRNASLFSDCAGTSEPANQRPAAVLYQNERNQSSIRLPHRKLTLHSSRTLGPDEPSKLNIT